MRRSIGLIALAVSATLLSAGFAQAKDPLSRLVNDKTKSTTTQTQTQTQKAKSGPTEAKPLDAPKPQVIRTHENLDVTPEEKKKAVVAQQAATVEEQRIAGQLRGLQAFMQKEELALAQRLEYAGKVRAQGLTKNDQKLLDQAEQLERQALDYYQKRIQQFEKFSVTSAQQKKQQQTPTKARTQSTRSSRPTTNNYRSSSRSRSSSSRYRRR